MIKDARYVHTNLIARDWKALAQFYETHFACIAVQPERNYAGPEIEAGTGIADVKLCGIHLRLPGHGERGPTLEIFNYSRLAEASRPAVNRPGFGHIAFEVRSVSAARNEILAAGGKAIGEAVSLTTADGKRVTWCYVTDPEGNIIELQSWS